MFCFFTLWFFFKDTHNFAIFFKSRKRALNYFLIPFSVITPERSWSGWIYECTIGWLVSKPPLFPIEPVVTSRTWGEYFSTIIYGQKPFGVLEVVEVSDRFRVNNGARVNEAINREEVAETHTLLNEFLTLQETIARQIWTNITHTNEIKFYIQKIFNDLSFFNEGQERNIVPLTVNVDLELVSYKVLIESTQRLIEFNSKRANLLKDNDLIDKDTKKLILNMDHNAQHFCESSLDYIQLVEQTSLQYKNLTDCMEAFQNAKNSHFTYIDEDTILWNENTMINLLKKAEGYKLNLEECLRYWELSIAKNGFNLLETYSLVGRTRHLQNLLDTAPEIARVAALEIPIYDNAFSSLFIGKEALFLVALIISLCFFQASPFKSFNSFLQGVDLNFFSNNLSNRTVLFQSANEKVLVCHFQMISIILLLFFFILIPFFFKLFLENKNKCIFFYYTGSVFDYLDLFRLKIKKYF